MKTGKDIVCISMTTWEGDYMKTIVHMMTQLAKNHRVLFVDYPFTVKDVVTSVLGKSNAPVKRMLGISKRLRKLESKGNEVYHLTLPPVFPISWINDPKSFLRLTTRQSKIIQTAIRSAMTNLGFESPIVINAFNPMVGLPLVGKLGESELIYYCYDEIRAAEWCGKHGGMMEDEFIKQVDRVIVTSEGLLESKSQKHAHVSLIKNGVDFELFNRAATPLRIAGRSVVGYVGSVDFRLDYDLLEFLVKSNPDLDFHFVGRVTYPAGKSQLGKYENVRFFGAQQPNDIPKLMSNFDLGIIPFVKNEFTQNVYPLKINEYLAAGLPVVSTDFASLVDFESSMSIGTSTEDFNTKMIVELRSDNKGKSAMRMHVAQQNDWSVRAELLEEILLSEK